MLFLDRWDTKRSQKKGFNVYSEQIVLRCPKPKEKKKTAQIRIVLATSTSTLAS